MKRKGYILEKIADWDNLVAASYNAQEGKVKTNRHIREHNKRREQDLKELQRMILTLDFPDAHYTSMQIKSDAGKVREISKLPFFPYRILHHAIMQVVGDTIYKNLIYDTSACIRGKGLHFGVRRMKMFLRRYPQYKYFVKTDLKKFYQSIPHKTVMDALSRKFKDKRFLKLIDITILNYRSDVTAELMYEYNRKRTTYRSIYQSATG